MPGRLNSLPLSSVRLDDGFWSKWQFQMAERGLPHQWRQCEETGRMENLRRAARGESGGFAGYRFNDSDIYKLLEASAYATEIGMGGHLAPFISEATDLVCAAQQPDGYINSFVQLDHSDMKWRSLNALHEMYCIGHLAEAGVAMFSATGKDRLIDASRRAMDCIMAEFGPDRKLGYADHQESELALVRLAHATGESKYLDYAKWQVRVRGSRPSPFEAELTDPDVVAVTPGVKALYMKDGAYDGAYAQDDVPLVHQTTAVGHAVRAMYYYCGAVDALGDDEPTMAALQSIWESLVSRRMYVTGGIGSSGRNEGFTDDYDLPNIDAYAETCAGIGLVFWAWRMFLWTGEGRFVEVMERALYNAVLSGVSLSCDEYFYDNPLESEGRHQRKPWFSCACCPPNIARLIMSIGQYAVAEGDGSVIVAMPVAGSYKASSCEFVIEGGYPWNGEFALRVGCVDGLRTLGVRVPDWMSELSLSANGMIVEPVVRNGVAYIERNWQAGDELAVSGKTQAEWLSAHPKVLSCAGRTALQRGPFVYCLEEHDLRFPPQHFSVDSRSVVEKTSSDDRMSMRLEVEGMVDGSDQRELYASVTKQASPRKATMVPYFSWANRGPNAMQVWLRQIS